VNQIFNNFLYITTIFNDRIIIHAAIDIRDILAIKWWRTANLIIHYIELKRKFLLLLAI